MKIRSLDARGFGALGDLSLLLDGKSAVLLGGNEAGKTAFVDAVSCALYGPPRANTALGRVFSIRYGDKYSAEAVLQRQDGTPVPVSALEPLQAESHPYELFRSLLVIREGECRLPERDKRFMESFSAKVLGAGSINIREAMRAVKRIYSPDERHRWSHVRSELQAATAASKAALLLASEMERAAAEKLELNAQLAALEKRAVWLDRQRRRLEYTQDRQRLERLKNAQAQLNSTARELKELEGLDRSSYTRLSLLASELAEAEKETTEKKAVSARLEKTMAEASAVLAQTDARLSEISDPEKRPRLKTTCQELLRLRAELDKLSSGRKLRRYAPAMAALAAAAPAAFLLRGMEAYSAAIWTLIIATAAYFAALMLLPGESARQRLASQIEKTGAEFSDALQALGPQWSGLDETGALARLETDFEEELRLRERRDVTERLFSGAETENADEKAALSELESKTAQLRQQLACDLKRFGAADVPQLLAKTEKLEYLHRTHTELRRSVLREADVGAADFDRDLEKAILELERRCAQESPEDPAQRNLTLVEAGEQAARAAAELKKLAVERETISKQLLNATEKLARSEGELGMPAADVFLRSRENQARLDDMEDWRAAAEDAFQILAGLANASEETMKNCVENAGPLFSSMTRGRYSGLRLESHSPFEQGALSVRHAVLGEKPLEWLSAGAQDLVWLSMRIVFAASGWREPSFMVLDEPFAALDPSRTEQALSALTQGPLSGWQILLLTKNPETAELCAKTGMARHTLGKANLA